MSSLAPWAAASPKKSSSVKTLSLRAPAPISARHVAELSKEMITTEGMGEQTRNLVFPDPDTGYYTITTGKPYSEKTAELIDTEVKALSDEAAARAEAVLRANLPVLDALAGALLEHETLEEKDLAPILKPAKLPTSAKLH